MKKTRKRLLVALCVVVGLVVVLSVAVRVILTRDVLMELVLPRLERAVRAEITVDDIGVRFPFGFGVDIEGLSFEKTLPRGEVVGFESERIVARASLISLIRRKPVITRIDIDNGRISAAGGPQKVDAWVGGLRASLSMRPEGAGYRVMTNLAASDVTFALREKPPVDLGAIGFESEMTLNAAFDSLHIDRGEVRWGEAAEIDFSGSVGDLKRSRRISLGLSSRGIEIPRLVERVKSVGLAPAGSEGRPPAPFDVREGTVDVEATVSGSLARPSGISISGTSTLDGVVLRHPAVPGEIAAGGTIAFSETNLRSDGISISFGSSKATVGFDADVVDRTKLGTIKASVDAALAIGDLVPPEQRGPLGAAGSLGLELDLRGTQADLAALARLEPGQEAPKKLGEAWRSVGLRGTVTLADMAFAPEGGAFRVKGLSGKAAIEGGDLKAVDVVFRLNGSPYSCKAALGNVIPASMELLAMSKDMSGKQVDDLGPLLRGIENVPRFDLKLAGRSLDLRPFERKKGGAAAAASPGAPPRQAPPANPFAFLALENTIFDARIDSVVTAKAVFTAVSAKGTVKEGLLTADPVTLQYAGGAGRARFEADLRRPNRIENRLDVSFDGIQAGRALGAMHPLGNLLSGSFSFSTDASFASGPGLDLFSSLSGRGSALSSSGSVDISRFLAPITQTGLIDLSHLSKFDFREWRGDFLVRDGRFRTDNWAIKSNKGDWAIKGSFGFDGTLDYAVRLVVPPAVQSRMKDLSKYRDLVDLFRDAQGNLVLDLDLGGTSTEPKVSIDMSGAKEKAADKARDELLKKAKDLLRRK